MDLFWFNNQQKPIPTRYHADEQRTRLGRWLVNRRFTRVSPWVVIGDPALLCFLFLFAANCNYLLQKQRSTWRHWYLRCPWRNMQKKFLVFTRMHRNTTTPRDTPYGNEMLSHAHEVICFCMSLRVLRNTPFTRYNRLYNQFDNRLYRVNKHPTGGKTGCQTGLTTVLNEQPLFVSFNRLSHRVVQPDWQPAVYTIQPFVKRVVPCIQTFTRLSNRFDNRLYRANRAYVFAHLPGMW